ncbi:MAG TPA: hypothetical protein VKY33_02700 [Flavobacterium sp.]|nr:hypothetical protein [Flavobacterium sp.]
MKQFIYRNAGILLSIFMVVFASSCSGNDDSNPFGEEASFSMKVNGENWSSSITTLFTEEEYNNGEGYYFVYIGGSKIMDMENPTGNDTTESMAIYIAIPFSKAQNPKGTYPIIRESDVTLNQAQAIFMSNTDGQQNIYTITNPGQSGTVEITGFEFGEQTIMGEPTGAQGYTKLSGNFQVELNSIADDTDKLIITNGKFNLSSGLGF